MSSLIKRGYILRMRVSGEMMGGSRATFDLEIDKAYGIPEPGIHW